MTATIEMNDALDAFIKYYHNNATESCWLRVMTTPMKTQMTRGLLIHLPFLIQELGHCLKMNRIRYDRLISYLSVTKWGLMKIATLI